MACRLVCSELCSRIRKRHRFPGRQLGVHGRHAISELRGVGKHEVLELLGVNGEHVGPYVPAACARGPAVPVDHSANASTARPVSASVNNVA